VTPCSTAPDGSVSPRGDPWETLTPVKPHRACVLACAAQAVFNLVPLLRDSMVSEEVLHILLRLSERAEFKNVFMAAGAGQRGNGSHALAALAPHSTISGELFLRLQGPPQAGMSTCAAPGPRGRLPNN